MTIEEAIKLIDQAIVDMAKHFLVPDHYREAVKDWNAAKLLLNGTLTAETHEEVGTLCFYLNASDFFHDGARLEPLKENNLYKAIKGDIGTAAALCKSAGLMPQPAIIEAMRAKGELNDFIREVWSV